MRVMKSWLFFIVWGILLLPGCAVFQSQQSISVRGLTIRNDSNRDIRNIRLYVERTRSTVTCTFIPAGGEFSTEFPLRTYQGNYVITAWQQNGRQYETPPLYAHIPEDLDRTRPVDAVVTINQQGTVTVELSP